MNNKVNVAVIGASGYAGAELVGLLLQHPHVQLTALLVSESSEDKNKLFSQLYPKFQGACALSLQGFSQQWLAKQAQQSTLDYVFLATPHEFSANWAHQFLASGIKVIDLSGGFRLVQAEQYQQFYQFEHQSPELLAKAQYGLVDFYAENIKQAQLIAVPGCYPTASLLAIKPVCDADLVAEPSFITVNGISGASGAGRKANLATSFCELSLKPYNILRHRHQPEISQYCAQQVVFNPHIAPFKRGLLATVTAQLKSGVTTSDIKQCFEQAYCNNRLVQLTAEWPQIDDVATTPLALVHYQVDEQNQILVACCAIDNLLKGAAAQAMQCLNLQLGLAKEFNLVPFSPTSHAGAV